MHREELRLYSIWSGWRRIWRGPCGAMRQPVPRSVVRLGDMGHLAELDDHSRHRAKVGAYGAFKLFDYQDCTHKEWQYNYTSLYGEGKRSDREGHHHHVKYEDFLISR